MNAREMILNHASLSVGDPTVAIDFLKDAVSGAAQLVKEGVVGSVLRADRGAQEIYCAEGFSLFDVVQELRKSGARDEHLFFARMVTKTPLLDGIGADDRQRFLGCETRDLPPEDGDPLLLCALTHAVAVGFPTHEDWDRDRVTVRFEELLPDGTFSPESEDIDHLARATHAAPICARHRHRLRAGLQPGELWKNREAAFSNLAFGPDVENHLEELPAGLWRAGPHGSHSPPGRRTGAEIRPVNGQACPPAAYRGRAARPWSSSRRATAAQDSPAIKATIFSVNKLS